MSYRELRNFAEIMRTLGYKRVISLENFRKPNFELVADTLYHMVKLYDPETSIKLSIELERDRVEFLTSIATFLSAKARLKLNTKKLYASDGRAVQELLKLATLLHKATQAVLKSSLDENIPPPIKVQDVKVARTLASEITQIGAKLSDLLQNESSDRLERMKALRFLDQTSGAAEGSREYTFIERSVREQIEMTKEAVEDLSKETQGLDADEKNLESKIKKKQEELERTEKRLRSLESAKPQFMEEVENLEKELRYQYDIYVEKYKNLDYLEHELGRYHKLEEERKLQHDKKLERMRQRLNKEQLELFQGGKGGGANDEYEHENDNRKYSSNRGGNSSKGNSTNRDNGRGAKVQGSMRGATARSDEESSGGGSEEEMSGAEEGGSNLGDSDEEELSVASRSKTNAQTRGQGQGQGQGQGHANRYTGNGGAGGGGGGGYGKAGGGGAAMKRQVSSDDEDDFVDDDEDDDDMSGGGDDDDDDDGNF